MIIGRRAAKCKCSLELPSILKINLLALNGRRDLERAKMERNGAGHFKCQVSKDDVWLRYLTSWLRPGASSRDSATYRRSLLTTLRFAPCELFPPGL